MNRNILVFMPGKTSIAFQRIINGAIEGYNARIVTRVRDIPLLNNRKVLWAIELNKYGFNLTLEKMLQNICQKGEDAFKNTQGAIIIQSPVELWTKYNAYRIIFQTNQLGCSYIGHPVVEAAENLVNFKTWQKQLKISLPEIYQQKSRNVVYRLMVSQKVMFKKPKILVLYSNPRKTSNTMMLWQMVRRHIPNNQIELTQQHVENGTIVDCRGCLYKTCKHYSEKQQCFYGGIVVQEILPAIEKADCLIWLCPNYNDAVSAKLMAVINRLTVLYKRVDFHKKLFFAIIVSGNSGSENVAIQLIGSLNVNKGFILPANFALMAIANDPGTVKKIVNINKKAQDFAGNIGKQLYIHNNSPQEP